MEIKQRIIQKVRKIEDPETLYLLENWLDSSSGLEECFTAEELEAVEGYAE